MLSGILILLFLSLLLLTIFLLNLPNLNCTFFFRSVTVFVWTNDTFSVFWRGWNTHVSFSERKLCFLISYHHTKKKSCINEPLIGVKLVATGFRGNRKNCSFLNCWYILTRWKERRFKKINKQVRNCSKKIIFLHSKIFWMLLISLIF